MGGFVTFLHAEVLGGVGKFSYFVITAKAERWGRLPG